jgi:hypothetical protein
MQESEPESEGSDPDSGPSSPESFASWDPATSSWRTSALSLFGGLTEFSGTWPRRGMMRNGTCSVRRTSALPISAGACSLLRGVPTPRSVEWKANEYQQKDGNSWFTLTGWARMWPTPNVPNGGRTLSPGTTMTGKTPDGKKRQVGLENAVKLWPTPTSNEDSYRLNGDTQQSKSLGAMAAHEGRALGTGGQLNPTWVEWLMGFPLGWTDLER